MKKYKFIENEAIADIAFEAYGKDLNELFENSALAVFESSAEIKTIKPKIKKEIRLSNEKIDDLLFDFLSEIIYLKDKDSVIFSKSMVNIEENKKYKLTAVLEGENINQEKHTLLNDVKAVTLHLFKVEKIKDQWRAHIILDI